MAPSTVLTFASLTGLHPQLVDLLVRESALALARSKLTEARNGVLAEKARLEAKTGLLKNIAPGSGQGRDSELNSALNDIQHYDLQLKKADSLVALINKDIQRWLECSMKTGSPDYVASMAAHEHAEDWSRFAYGYELLVKSFQMGLQGLMMVFRRETAKSARSELLLDSIRKLLPIARQIEIDIEFFNRVLAQQAKLARVVAGKPVQHPEYSWCETTAELSSLPLPDAMETLRELISASNGFLPSLGQAMKREQFMAETRAAQSRVQGTAPGPGFFQMWWEGLKPAAAQRVDAEKLGALITETETLLMDGEFSARFNRHMLQGVQLSSAAAPAAERQTSAPFPQGDAELRALKAKLQAELEEVAKTKAGLASRERTLKENEQKLRDQEAAFDDKCRRSQEELDALRSQLEAREADIVAQERRIEELRAEELAKLEETKAELAMRASFLEESEQRLITKGQEQLERLAELEQKEDELMSTKRELNGMRKEMGLPLIPLRAKPVDEFEE